MKSPSSNFLVLGNVRHLGFSLENRCSKCFRSHKAYCVTMAQKRVSMNNSLFFIPCNARIVSILLQKTPPNKTIANHFQKQHLEFFFQIPFILCCDYIRQQVRIDCSELNTDSKLGLTFFEELLGEIGKKFVTRQALI